jgi:hypothetical protein
MYGTCWWHARSFSLAAESNSTIAVAGWADQKNLPTSRLDAASINEGAREISGGLLMKLRICLLCAVVATTAARPGRAQVIPPIGLIPGSQYQLLFVTAGTDTSTSSNIADYNSFVSNQAALSSSLPAATWHAIVSTSAVNASANAPWISGLPVYNTQGIELITGAQSLYNHALLSAIQYDQSGQSDSSLIWTGSSFSGAAQGPLGGANVGLGFSGTTSLDWIHDATSTSATQLPLYALSGAITVPIPEPATMTLAVLACLCGAVALTKSRIRASFLDTLVCCRICLRMTPFHRYRSAAGRDSNCTRSFEDCG